MNSRGRRVLSLLLALLAPTAAQAGLTVSVNLSSQSMVVAEDGAVRHRWPISSGRIGYRTPNGVYRPGRLARMHYSRKYGMTPMPHSIFFRGGYAIHGTGELRRLGRTASHGCIRLSPGNAAALYGLVQAYGRGGTRIVITGSAGAAEGGGLAARPRLAARARFAAPQMRTRRTYAPRSFEHPYVESPFGYDPYAPRRYEAPPPYPFYR